MKTTLAIVATVLFMILAACGEPDYIQTNEPESVDAGTQNKHDMQFPEVDAGTAPDNKPEPSCQYVLYCRDKDGDGYGRLSLEMFAACAGEYYPGYVTEYGDCNDHNPRVYPGAPELCNGVDDDCDMVIDENCPTLLVSLNPGSPSGAALIGVDVQALKFSLQSTGDNIIVKAIELEFHGCALGGQTRLYNNETGVQFGDARVAGWNTTFEVQPPLTVTTLAVPVMAMLDTDNCQNGQSVQIVVTNITTENGNPVTGLPLTGHLITF